MQIFKWTWYLHISFSSYSLREYPLNPKNQVLQKSIIVEKQLLLKVIREFSEFKEFREFKEFKDSPITPIILIIPIIH